MSIANDVFDSTNEARRSYYDHKEKWDRIFKMYRQGDYINIPLSAVYNLIPAEYRYYADGYLSFFCELGFGVELPGPLFWQGYNMKTIRLSQGK